jgi:hypothetical protein
MKKKRTVNPELKQVLAELEEVVQRVGFKVRYEKGNFEGGYCILKESRLFVINTRTEPERRVSIISRGLKDIGIESIFIKPQIRLIIENESIVPATEEEHKEEDGNEEDSQEEANEEQGTLNQPDSGEQQN